MMLSRPLCKPRYYSLFFPSNPQHRQILSTTLSLSPRGNNGSSTMRRSSKNAWKGQLVFREIVTLTHISL
jgi:hypothetical protein